MSFNWWLDEDGVENLVQGSTTKCFKVERGLRQGDRMSPLLFNLVGEGLNVLIKKRFEERDIRRSDGGRYKSNFIVTFRILSF